MTPFINIFNEFYAKDTSRKISAVFKLKGMRGKPLTTNPPYGYLKSKKDKFQWIIDEEATDVIREMFHLCKQGYGASQIAHILSERHIMNPTAHVKSLGINSLDTRTVADDYYWRSSTIAHILAR